jgi:hypothetical protein
MAALGAVSPLRQLHSLVTLFPGIDHGTSIDVGMRAGKRQCQAVAPIVRLPPVVPAEPDLIPKVTPAELPVFQPLT